VNAGLHPGDKRDDQPPDQGREQSLAGESSDLGMHLLAGLDLDAEVVDRAAPAGILQQHQLERRFSDGEVGVALFHLGRCSVPRSATIAAGSPTRAAHRRMTR
jgi:hypothetical protein